MNGRARRRRKPPGATTRGGWGHQHQRQRAALAPIVASGRAVCARCLQPIKPSDDWHLDHSDSRDGYIGVSHALCNLQAAAAKTNGRRTPTAIHEEERLYRWSQKWFDDPPVGTICRDEIYLGNGEWSQRHEE